jgi:ABC-type dipeptide/oligopeptide/nickel transport system ATPase component
MYVLEESNIDADDRSVARQGSKDHLLVIDGLRLSADGFCPVDGATFRIKEGEFVALVGASGSGKTLTALAVIGLLPPEVALTGGSIRLRDRELITLNEKAWRKIRGSQITMIFQEPGTSLNPVMTVGAQIIEAVTQHRRCSRAEARGLALEALRAVQIPDAEMRLRTYPHQLSGGLRQRVMIATALSCRPELLIADEPTTALDVTIQAGIIKLLQRIRRERSLAILLITHDIALAAEAADRIVVMEKGKIIEEGTPQQIIEQPHNTYTVKLIEHCRRRDAGFDISGK